VTSQPAPHCALENGGKKDQEVGTVTGPKVIRILRPHLQHSRRKTLPEIQTKHGLRPDAAVTMPMNRFRGQVGATQDGRALRILAPARHVARNEARLHDAQTIRRALYKVIVHPWTRFQDEPQAIDSQYFRYLAFEALQKVIESNRIEHTEDRPMNPTHAGDIFVGRSHDRTMRVFQPAQSGFHSIQRHGAQIDDISVIAEIGGGDQRPHDGWSLQNDPGIFDEKIANVAKIPTALTLSRTVHAHLFFGNYMGDRTGREIVSELFSGEMTSSHAPDTRNQDQAQHSSTISPGRSAPRPSAYRALCQDGECKIGECR